LHFSLLVLDDVNVNDLGNDFGIYLTLTIPIMVLTGGPFLFCNVLGDRPFLPLRSSAVFGQGCPALTRPGRTATYKRYEVTNGSTTSRREVYTRSAQDRPRQILTEPALSAGLVLTNPSPDVWSLVFLTSRVCCTKSLAGPW